MPQLHESARLLDAVHNATRKLATGGDVAAVLRDVLEISVEAVGAQGGTVYMHEPLNRTLRFLHVLPEEVAERIERFDIADDFGVAGLVFQTGKAQITNLARRPVASQSDIEKKAGVVVKNMITVPLAIAGLPPIGVVQLVNKKNGNFNESDETVLDIISDVSAMAVINSRLLDQQTKMASLEGMGRAAHDLANKAGVLVTFLPAFETNLDALRESLGKKGADAESMFYLDMLQDTYRDVFSPYSERVLRYARLINDLAAGKKLTPKLKVQSLPQIVHESAQYLESTARQGQVKLAYDLETDVPDFEFDDLYVIRIVENLVGNAIKAVREKVTDEWLAENRDSEDAVLGTVTVRTSFKEGSPGVHRIEVEDDGPGMPPVTVRAIMAGQAVSQWVHNPGSGIGMKVVHELTQALGGKLSVRSKLGQGSLFAIDLPVR